MRKLFGLTTVAVLACGFAGVSPAAAGCDTEDSTLLFTTGELPYGSWVSIYEGGEYGYQVEDQVSLVTGCSDGTLDAVTELVPLP